MTKYEQLVNLAGRRSIFYPASEIYTTTPAGLWSYGCYGVSIRHKLLDIWRKHFVREDGLIEIDGAVLMPADVLKASGHLGKFSDPITVCKKCNAVHRADKILTEVTGHEYREAQTNEELIKALRAHAVKCPACKKGELADVTRSSLMVQAPVGVGRQNECYLRPESCQSIFTDYLRMTKTMRVKLPFGIAQQGKVFRNEISPRQTLIRQIEFYAAEMEMFFDPKHGDYDKFETVKDYPVNIQRAGQEKIEQISAGDLVKNKIVSNQLIAYYLARTQQFFSKLGIPVEVVRFRELPDDERAFYAKEAFDFEVKTSIGWVELVANNYRTDYDLSVHSEGSKKDLSFVDEKSRVLPHVWEISMGFDRTFLVMLEFALKEEKERTFLSLPANLAPLHAGVFPLLSNKPELVSKAEEVYNDLKSCYELFYDESGSIGKRYARMDEIGVPFCITVDFDSLKNNDVTVRERDGTKQIRIKISELREFLFELIAGKKKV
ncbi:MAG: glycine--tRNA ligase [Candidatus Aenigmarchaeota archaeon]|nr:glycine--tRNA ligase [Candidatus Aenigmarchaeota archaeon]